MISYLDSSSLQQDYYPKGSLSLYACSISAYKEALRKPSSTKMFNSFALIAKKTFHHIHMDQLLVEFGSVQPCVLDIRVYLTVLYTLKIL